jgi:hypothetical protein
MSLIPKRVVVLAVIDFAEGAEFVATERYTARPSDAYPNAYFDGVLKPPRIGISGSFVLWRSDSSASVPKLELTIWNYDGSYDHWLLLSWKGKRIRLYIAETLTEENPSFSDFHLLRTLEIENLAFEGESSVKITTLDIIGKLQKKRITYEFAGAPNAEINGTAQMLPLGNLRYAPAVLYQTDSGYDYFILCDDGAAGYQEIIGVYENGVERNDPTDIVITPPVSFYRPIGTSSAGFWQIELAGIRRLPAAGGAWVETLHQAIEWLLIDRAGLTASDVDFSTLADIPDLAVCWHNKQQHFSAAQLLLSLLDSVNATVWERNDGVLAFAIMHGGTPGAPTSGAPVYVLAEQIDEISETVDEAPGLSKSTVYDVSYARKSTSVSAPSSALQASL